MVGDFSLSYQAQFAPAGLPFFFYTGLISFWACGWMPRFERNSTAIWHFIVGDDPYDDRATLTIPAADWYAAPILLASFQRPPLRAEDAARHLIISFDIGAQIVQAYMNGVRMAEISVVWTSVLPYDNRPVDPDVPSYQLGGASVFGHACYMGDFWCGIGMERHDLDDPAVLAKFINRRGMPVDLGPTGAIPFGAPPQIYFHADPTGVPADFTTNRGTAGGVWIANNQTVPGGPSIWGPPDPPLIWEPDGFCWPPSPAAMARVIT